MHIAAALSIIKNNAGTTHKKELAALLNELILHRFDLLITLLYTVDVPEEKAKQLLRQQPHTDAGMLLAELLLQRQAQKESMVKTPTSDPDRIPDEDRW